MNETEHRGELKELMESYARVKAGGAVEVLALVGLLEGILVEMNRMRRRLCELEERPWPRVIDPRDVSIDTIDSSVDPPVRIYVAPR